MPQLDVGRLNPKKGLGVLAQGDGHQIVLPLLEALEVHVGIRVALHGSSQGLRVSDSALRGLRRGRVLGRALLARLVQFVERRQRDGAVGLLRPAQVLFARDGELGGGGHG